MSRDDKDGGVVYILTTKGGRGKEYRAIRAQAQAIDQTERSSGGLNAKRILLLFGKCRVFTDRKIAEGYIGEDYDGTECGLVVLDYAHIHFPRESC